jgi:hypothetical protein
VCIVLSEAMMCVYFYIKVSGCQVENLEAAFQRLQGPMNSTVDILVQVISCVSSVLLMCC